MVGHLQQENGQLKAKLRGGVAEVRVTIVTVIIVTVPIITVIVITILIMITPPTLNTVSEICITTSPTSVYHDHLQNRLNRWREECRNWWHSTRPR